MPYNTINDLPDKIKDNLSTEAQKAFLKAFNTALEFYKDEIIAFKIAWSAANKVSESFAELLLCQQWYLYLEKAAFAERYSIEEAVILLKEWKEWPVKYRQLNTEKDMEQLRDELRLISALATRLDKGQKLQTKGHEITYDEAVDSAVAVLKSLLDADAIILHSKRWKPTVREFLKKVTSKVRAQGYVIPIEE